MKRVWNVSSRHGGLLMLCGLLALPGCLLHRVEPPPVARGNEPGQVGPDGKRRVELDPYRISPEPDPVLGEKAWNAESLFHEGEERFDAGEFGPATEVLHRLVEEFPESRFAAPGLLLLGMSELGLHHGEASIPWFEHYLKEYPNGSQKWFAYRGLGDAHALLKDWPTSEKDFRTLLALPHLNKTARDNGRVRLARALVEQGRLDEGAPILEDIVKRHGPLARGSDGYPEDTEVGAMARYYLGEVARLKCERIVLNQAIDLSRAEAQLDKKADLLLEAHHEYYRTFVYDVPQWTAAAAFRMGYLYERFYDDLLSSPTPPGLSAEDIVLYREALDDRLVAVVKRAYNLYDQVLRNADQLKLEGEWVERCREGIARLESRVRRAPASADAAAAGSHASGGSRAPEGLKGSDGSRPGTGSTGGKESDGKEGPTPTETPGKI